MILTREVQAVKKSLGSVHSLNEPFSHLKNGLDRYLYLSSIKKLSMQSELHIPIFNFPSPVWKINETFWHMDNFQLDTLKEIFSFYSNLTKKCHYWFTKSSPPLLSADKIPLPPPHTHIVTLKHALTLEIIKKPSFCLGIDKLDTVSCSKEIYDPCEKTKEKFVLHTIKPERTDKTSEKK